MSGIPASAAGAQRAETETELEFLVVDEFMRTLVDARALKTAFELGLIDRLAEQRRGSAEALGRASGTDPQGLRFLLDLLVASGVVEERGGDVALTRRFGTALRYRDLLEAKLDFAGFTIDDFADYFTALIKDPATFMGRARLFQLFDYRRALEPSDENYQRTRAWMRITSTLTRYEARACMRVHDFSAHRRMLDVGGNSGEFALQLCRRNPELRATILDLPLVCEIGMEHVLAEPEGARIGFRKADLRNDPLPAGYDLVTFKSMLHDWPPEQAAGFIAKAAAALAPGGTLLIFERGPLPARAATPPFSMLPHLLFFRSYRSPSGYTAQLEALGFEAVTRHDVPLDAPFFVVAGRKAAA
ncbi:MAG TPA: methyltransferase [Burkholderiales bacterium]|nr:methyltransferase [Burkholderiales bacterium]